MPRRFHLHPLVAVLFGLSAVLLCFGNKAIHIDDPLYVWTAEHIRQKPLDFYGFEVNWSGKNLPMYQSNYNPPLCAYYLALVMQLFGSREFTLHAAFCLPTLMLAAGIYFFAKPFCQRPIVAVLLAVLTPIFLVSATTLMCDVPMLMFWIWSMVCWDRGLKGNGWLLLIAGLLAGLAILTKYNAILLLPLLALMAVQHRKRWPFSLAGLAVPVIILLVYERYTSRLYGEGLFQLSSRASGAKHQALVRDIGFQAITCLAFLGAGMASISFTALRAWSWKTVLGVLGATLAIAAVIGVVSEDQAGIQGAGTHLTWPVLLQVAIWSVLGLGVLTTVCLIWLKNRDPINLLFCAWIGLGLFYSTFVNWMLSGRSLLLMVPACAIIFARWLDRSEQNAGAKWRLWASLVPAGFLAIWAAQADFSFANSVRATSRRICQQLNAENQRPVWFLGHWGFQYYMQELGCQPLDLTQPAANPGDWLVVPYNNVMIFVLPPGVISQNQVIKTHPYWGLAVMQVDASAGFYSSNFGRLPFVFGAIPDDAYYLQKLNQPLRPVME